MPTRSPGPTPRSASPSRTASTRRPNSAYVVGTQAPPRLVRNSERAPPRSTLASSRSRSEAGGRVVIAGSQRELEGEVEDPEPEAVPAAPVGAPRGRLRVGQRAAPGVVARGILNIGQSGRDVPAM